MLIGCKCKVGNKNPTKQEAEGFSFYEGIVVGGPSHLPEGDDWFILVLCEGKLLSVDVYYVYDLELPESK